MAPVTLTVMCWVASLKANSTIIGGVTFSQTPDDPHQGVQKACQCHRADKVYGDSDRDDLPGGFHHKPELR